LRFLSTRPDAAWRYCETERKLFFMHSFRFYGSQHDLKPGDNIDIHVQGERAFAIEKAPGARELLARLRKYRGRLPADFKFDRLEANERG
jgi:antitoxin MazE